jgi:uracil-DNA glycosylase
MALTEDRINREDLASAISWWVGAGVDCVVEEAPTLWLGRGESPIATPTVAEVVAPAAMPHNLAALTQWLMTNQEIPDAGPAQRRVAPSGDSASGFMILIDMPEAGDADAGHLLSGEVSELVDRMLGAIGRDRNSVYIASLSPGRTPTGRLSDAGTDRLTEIARHHVALVKPDKLWLMGRAASRAMIGVDDVMGRGSLHVVNHQGGMTAAITSAHPRVLLQTPKRKAEVWADMQRLIKGIEA